MGDTVEARRPFDTVSGSGSPTQFSCIEHNLGSGEAAAVACNGQIHRVQVKRLVQSNQTIDSQASRPCLAVHLHVGLLRADGLQGVRRLHGVRQHDGARHLVVLALLHVELLICFILASHSQWRPSAGRPRT